MSESPVTPTNRSESQSLESSFREREVTVKEREIALREAELALKRDDQARASWRSPLVVAVMAATLAGLSNAGITLVNGRLQRELEDGRAEQTRVLEMIKTGDPDKAADNLQFLLDAGLISDPGRSSKLTKYLSSRAPGSGPVLPSPSTGGPYLGGITGVDDAIAVESLRDGSIRKAAGAVGRIRGVDGTGRTVFCTGFLIGPNLALTAAHCLQNFTAVELLVRVRNGDAKYKVNLPAVHVAGNVGFALIRLDGTPGNTHGVLRLSAEAPTVGQALAIILFRATEQQLAVTGVGDCRIRLVDSETFYHLCDTGAGASGAPILSASRGEVIGVQISRSDQGGMAARSDVVLNAHALLRPR